MSNIANTKVQKGAIGKKLNVKDTDFLLKLMMNSSFEGTELELAYSVLTKLVEMHKVSLEA
tara:strand:+ start:1764 stop:1946 length:183 start_codon:yes stop_codon:yes gene_type:complete